MTIVQPVLIWGRLDENVSRPITVNIADVKIVEKTEISTIGSRLRGAQECLVTECPVSIADQERNKARLQAIGTLVSYPWCSVKQQKIIQPVMIHILHETALRLSLVIVGTPRDGSFSGIRESTLSVI